MSNGYIEIMKVAQFMVELLYNTKKTDEIEKARAYLKLLITNGDPKQVLDPFLPRIIEFAIIRKSELLKEDFKAFLDYDFKYNINISQLINIYKPLLNEEEHTLLWKKIKLFIAKSIKLHNLLT